MIEKDTTLVIEFSSTTEITDHQMQKLIQHLWDIAKEFDLNLRLGTLQPGDENEF